MHYESDQQFGGVRVAIGTLVTVLSSLSLAFAFYSIAVPIWSYGLFFGNKPNESNFIWHGLSAPFRDLHIRSLIVLGLLTVALTVSLSNRRASRFFARRYALVFFASVAVVLITALLIRWRVKAMYESAVRLRSDAQFARGYGRDIRNYTDVSNVGQVPDTAYFLYLDRVQINSLYSQVEPDWIEKQRTETNTSGGQAKVGVSGGLASGELGGSRGRQRQIVQEPAVSTSERNCLKFMQYEIERKRTRSFSNGTEWVVMNLLEPVTTTYLFKPTPESTDLPLNRREFDALQAEISLGYFDYSAATNAKINESLAKANWRAQLTGDLTSLQDFVFISGQFRRAWIRDDIVLVHDFVGADGEIGAGEKFRPVFFYVTLPPHTKDAELERISPTEKLTVFGKPVHGLDQQGMIEIRALAVY